MLMVQMAFPSICRRMQQESRQQHMHGTGDPRCQQLMLAGGHNRGYTVRTYPNNDHIEIVWPPLPDEAYLLLPVSSGAHTDTMYA